MPRTTKLSLFSRLFKDQSVLKVMESTKQDWKLLVLIKKGIRWFEGSSQYRKVPEVEKSVIGHYPY